MEFAELVRKRRIVRHFKTDPIEMTAIDRILDLARRVPSAGFTQGQDFIVVTDPAQRREVARLCGEEAHYEKSFGHRWISEAPVQIIPCANEGAYHRRYQESDKVGPDGQEHDWPVPYWVMDTGCSVMVLLLAVVDEGLAAGYAGFLDLPGARELLGIPEDVIPVGVIPIGYPDQDIPSPSLKRGRKAMQAIVHKERW
ncbi:MAG TPA: nitroreductase family protein [Nitrolancea sp.]|jgi:nitroreductase|nr:nitroreductase family protein [Nitrolancea sp.]